MPDLIRTFIAVTLPESLTDLVSEIQKTLKTQGLRIAWVVPGNVHLTLKFLGDIEPADVDPIAAVMSECAQPIAPLTLSARGLGVFPDLRHPRVLWLGITGDMPQLIAFQKDLDARLDALGQGRFKPEQRPFKGHLTLGRIKTRLDSGILLKALRETARDAHTFVVDAVHLIQSRLTPTGSIYTPLRRVVLGSSVCDLCQRNALAHK
ncbi:MAG: RNA 2',3'-cyclic phosphodiesterase [Deltaproteobacteria bacterium]|nr:RNA 2',3'-cyclic phosphodiesterase [Deltaproteobacteria bacterium]